MAAKIWRTKFRQFGGPGLGLGPAGPGFLDGSGPGPGPDVKIWTRSIPIYTMIRGVQVWPKKQNMLKWFTQES